MQGGVTRCIRRMGLFRGDDVSIRYRRLDMRCTRTKTEFHHHDLAQQGPIGGSVIPAIGCSTDVGARHPSALFTIDPHPAHCVNF